MVQSSEIASNKEIVDAAESWELRPLRIRCSNALCRSAELTRDCSAKLTLIRAHYLETKTP